MKIGCQWTGETSHVRQQDAEQCDTAENVDEHDSLAGLCRERRLYRVYTDRCIARG